MIKYDEESIFLTNVISFLQSVQPQAQLAPLTSQGVTWVVTKGFDDSTQVGDHVMMCAVRQTPIGRKYDRVR